MMLPTIHMNGTSRAELLAGYVEAIEALDEAIAALRRAAPNGRDYYPQSPQAYPQARDEHLARIAALDAIRQDLNTLADHAAWGNNP